MNAFVESGSAIAVRFAPLAAAILLKGAVILGAVAIGAALARHASAATRHYLWTLGVITVLLLPVFERIAPRWDVPRIHVPESWSTAVGPAVVIDDAGKIDGDVPGIAGRVETRPQSASGGSDRSDPSRLPVLLLSVWFAGSALLVALLAVGAFRLRRDRLEAAHIVDPAWTRAAAQAAERLGVESEVFLLRGRKTVVPQSWGVFRSVVLFPGDWDRWPAEKRQHALVHELAHVRRRDCLTQGIAQTACALFWFQPLFWYASHRLRVERERACDDLVLLEGARPSAYADHLLTIASAMRSGGVPAFGRVAMAFRSQISGRLLSVLDPDRRRERPSRPVIALTAALLFAGTLPLASLRPVSRVADAAVVGDRYVEADVSYVPPDLEGIRRELERINRIVEDAVREKNAARWADFYAGEFRSFPIGRPTIDTREGLFEQFDYMLSAGIEELDFAVLELYPVGRMVCEIGEWIAYGESRTFLGHGRYMTLWKRERGEWRIFHDMATS